MKLIAFYCQSDKRVKDDYFLDNYDETNEYVKDYITEKIFDCFLSRTVPIYWGAPNIDEIIPKECFIDFREFNNFEEMYEYIKNMSDEEYMKYINSINKFLYSDKSSLFTLDNWVKSVKTAIYPFIKDYIEENKKLNILEVGCSSGGGNAIL